MSATLAPLRVSSASSTSPNAPSPSFRSTRKFSIFGPEQRGSGAAQRQCAQFAWCGLCLPLDAYSTLKQYAKGALVRGSPAISFFHIPRRARPREKKISLNLKQGWSFVARLTFLLFLPEMMRLPILLGALSLGMALPAASFSPSGAAVTNGLRPAAAGPGAIAFRRSALRPKTCNHLPTASIGGGGGCVPCLIPRRTRLPTLGYFSDGPWTVNPPISRASCWLWHW